MSTKRIALITGANKGIGLETARQLGLAPHTCTVLLGARDAGRGREAADSLKKQGIDAHPITLDVTDEASIAAAAAQIGRQFGRLDILVNNAAINDKQDSAAASTTPLTTLRKTFDANFFGLIAVTQAMLPLISKSPAGRIVNLTSILGSNSEHSDPNSPIYNAKYTAYDTSKAAVNMYTQHLAHELRTTPIKVNAAHPGWVKTDMGGENAPLEVADGAKTSVWLATLPAEGPSGGFYHMMVHMRW